jgi:hypothetical protein
VSGLPERAGRTLEATIEIESFIIIIL